MSFKFRLTAVLFFVFFLALLPAGAQSFFNNLHWSYNGSLVFLASDNGIGADPAQIVPSIGVAAAYPIFRFLRVELTEDIYFTNYEYNWVPGYPMACNPENRKAFVMGFVTGFQVQGFFPIARSGIAVRVFGGPTFDFSLVIKAFGLNHPDDEKPASAHTEAISKYFWSNGRMLYSVAGVGMDFPLNEKFLLGFDLRAWIPLYRLWTNEEIPAIDGWRFGAGLRITPRK